MSELKYYIEQLQPIKEAASTGPSPLGNRPSGDSGVDISAIMNVSRHNWKDLI